MTATPTAPPDRRWPARDAAPSTAATAGRAHPRSRRDPASTGPRRRRRDRVRAGSRGRPLGLPAARSARGPPGAVGRVRDPPQGRGATRLRGLARGRRPLWETVVSAAVSAARTIRASARSPSGRSRRCRSTSPSSGRRSRSGIRPPSGRGSTGVIVERGDRRGLLLPEVATEQGWGVREMLEATCWKAGLPERRMARRAGRVYSSSAPRASASATEARPSGRPSSSTATPDACHATLAAGSRRDPVDRSGRAVRHGPVGRCGSKNGSSAASRSSAKARTERSGPSRGNRSSLRPSQAQGPPRSHREAQGRHMDQEWECLDGNEAAARVAYALSEVISIYPITPGLADGRALRRLGGRADSRTSGAPCPTSSRCSPRPAPPARCTARSRRAPSRRRSPRRRACCSMIPNMFKIAGELTPAVIHVAARTIATHALSIFGDHSDVMHARATGWAMLAAGSVQEAHDFALVAHAATLRGAGPVPALLRRLPHLARDRQDRAARRRRPARARPRGRRPRLPRARPDARGPVVRGTAQNPDVFFQAREAANPCTSTPSRASSRRSWTSSPPAPAASYGLVDYHGAPDAERVVVVMGSGAGAVEETVDALVAAGEKVGMLDGPPVPALPGGRRSWPRCRQTVAVDRRRSTGPRSRARSASRSTWRSSPRSPRRWTATTPPFADDARGSSAAATASRRRSSRRRWSSRSSTSCCAARPKRHFTVGIYDDVTHLSLPIDPAFRYQRPAGEVQALFFGLGSDGTVGANKASVKIIGEGTDLYAQGYFVYDSKKSGSVTVVAPALRPRADPLDLPDRRAPTSSPATSSGCSRASRSSTTPSTARRSCSTRPTAPTRSGTTCRARSSSSSSTSRSTCGSSTRSRSPPRSGMGNRINTVMQPCFFHLAGVLPADEAIARIKEFVEKTYAKRGEAVVRAQLRRHRPVASSGWRRCTLGEVDTDAADPAARPGRRARTSSATSRRG